MRNSKNYVMTAHVESAGDMLELETLRKAVKIMNKELRCIDATESFRKVVRGMNSFSYQLF